jgi:O-antigen/teichoic acid export membrane protein
MTISATETTRPRRDRLIGTAVALMATTATNSALGVIFWAIASHLHPAARLGEDVALISVMLLLSVVSQLNLGMGISRLLPQVLDRPGRVVASCYALTAVMAIAVTMTFVVVAPLLSESFDFVAGDAKLAAALVLGVVLWNVFTLQDAVLTSARWAPLVPVENAIFGVLKIALMIVLAGVLVSHGVFYAWLAAALLVLIPVNRIIFARVLRSPRSRRDPHAHRALTLSDRPRVARYLLTDYLAALLSQGYKSLLPLLVLAALGAASNAYFYIAFLVASAVGELSWSLSTSLVVQGAHDESDVSALARRSVGFYLRFVAPCVVVLIVAAPLALRPFGADYADHATTLLRLLLIATLPQAAVTLYLGVERVRARVGRVIAAEAAVVALVTGGAILGMRSGGLTGMGVAWLVGQTVVALAVAPLLWQACRRSTGNRCGVLA